MGSVTKVGGVEDRARIKTGTYTGDGNTSQAITGIGFTPKAVKIWPREVLGGTALNSYETTDTIVDDAPAGGALIVADAGLGQSSFNENQIISIDVDGFTVDDNGLDEHPNKLNQVYNYKVEG